MDDLRIVSIEWGVLEGRRPRKAGRNARADEHGRQVQVALARLTVEDGTTGFGYCQATQEQAQTLAGARLGEVFSIAEGAQGAGLEFDFPLWDLAGQLTGQPVYALVAHARGTDVEVPFRVPCYDTSLYFDDLALTSEKEAAALIAGEAWEGYERGHRAFKIKVGRGARHMPLGAGTRRDVAVVRAVRATVGPNCVLMLDANNGYNLNLAKRVLAETADCDIYWLEEPFHEDPILYRDLREWLKRRDLAVLIADGEGEAAPALLDWAREGFIDVIQYDIFRHGFTRWLKTGQQLDAWGVRSAPHHYGRHYGNYAAGHLAAAIQHFAFVEWDEASTPGLETGGYWVEEGWVVIPDAPGFGLALDDAVFRQAVERSGYVCTLPA